ncbi:uncharacterized protein LOC106778376 [Vigna radiata var. radiata]|uniref:Uncharacterized protein LOC106778376 n=1 Tax=Vigna radiata var. radiata TaxID=3916 RepID=A0A1S3VUT9_VIGRR|nr:uncharacterized protein LOC106778376 [Vigna radiata var. radiata]
MVPIEKKTQSSLHHRSTSFPSAAHPLVSQFEEHLQKLRGSESTSPSSSSSVSHKLSEMQDLHDCIDQLLQLPLEQQALVRQCDGKWVDDLLEGSLRLLDICTTAKDFLLKSKEIQKTLKSLKHKNNNTSSTLSFLDEAETITLSSLEHLLMFISGQKGHSKPSRWSAISNLMKPKREVCDSQESNTNEFQKVDAALQSLLSHKLSSIENFRSDMENLELCIYDLEIGVDHLSRKLIRNRVSLLNIFNH